VVDANRDSGAAVITMADGKTIDAGTGNVNIELRSGAGKTYTTSGDITLGSITAGSILVNNQGPTSGTNLSLRTGSTLTATNSGNSLILNAGSNGNFINNSTSSSLSAANGRWLVYSASPSGSTENGLTLAAGSTLPRLYNMTYAANPPSDVTESGNHLIYGYQPTLSITAENKSKEYGASDPAFTYTVSGYVTDDGVTDNETKAGLSGALNRASGETAGDYPINRGSLVSNSRYNINFTNGALTIKTANTTIVQVAQEAATIETTTAQIQSSSESAPVSVQIVAAAEPEKFFTTTASYENKIFTGQVVTAGTGDDKEKKKNANICQE
jgi:hypothetical protein